MDLQIHRSVFYKQFIIILMGCRIMKKIVIIVFLLFALLLTACGGKGNTGVSQAASGAAQPGDNSPSPVVPHPTTLGTYALGCVVSGR